MAFIPVLLGVIAAIIGMFLMPVLIPFGIYLNFISETPSLDDA